MNSITVAYLVLIVVVVRSVDRIPNDNCVRHCVFFLYTFMLKIKNHSLSAGNKQDTVYFT